MVICRRDHGPHHGIAFASLFAVMLDIQECHAAAADGNFFKIFARLHPTKLSAYFVIIYCRACHHFTLSFH
jgi:hypothetical protein